MTNILRGCFFGISIATMMSCGGLRPAPNTTPKPKPQPSTGTKPNGNGQGNTTSTVLVDTIRWHVDPKSRPPIITGNPGSNPPSGTPSSGTYNPNTGTYNPSTGTTTYPDGTVTYPSPNPTDIVTPYPGGVTITPIGGGDGVKNGYTLAVLMPFFTAQFAEGTATNPAKSQFALDFYAGVRLALDTLATQSMNMKVNVLDSRGDFNSILARYEVAKADVILGPVEKDNVPAAMDFANRQGKIYVSPYFPTGDIDNANPRFIQIKPSLKTHCENIMRNVRAKYKTEQIVLVGRQRDSETVRFKYFQDANSAINQANYGGRLDEWSIEDETNYTVEQYIHATGETVFVLPSWNEPFVAGFLRKLAASPRRAVVAVYGMPQWMDFDKSLSSLYESLKVRVSSSTFIEGNNVEVKNFRTRFMAKYGKLPNSDAYLGYDCTVYVGRMLMQYGTAFPQYVPNEQQQMLHTRFNFEALYRPVMNDSDPNGNISKYENKYVNILRFQNGAFRLD